MSIHQTIKTQFLKKATVLSATAFLTVCSAATYAQKANFSGEWKLNEQKSDLGQFAQMAPKKLKATSQADNLSIERFATGPDGSEANYTDKFTFDGKETETTLFGTAKKKSTAKWSDDGKSLMVKSNIVFSNEGQTFEVTINEVWKFLEDGKTLSVESTSTSQMGTNTTKMLFDKAS
jgi:hypothetical protein